MHFDTKSIHSGYDPESEHGSRAVPIYQTVAHLFRDVDHAAKLFASEEDGHIYSRISNPTVAIFEKRMAALENAEAGLATSSGMAAIFLLATHLASPRADVISSNRVYGGTFHLFAETLPRFGISVRFVENPHSIEDWERAITPNTKFLFVETPANPTAEIFHIRSLSECAHARQIPLVVDSTLATPALQRPFEHGADFVVHSATKYISGSGTALGGIILGGKAQLDLIRSTLLRDLGMSLAPFHAWLFLLGLESLPLRMKKHCENAARVAGFLAGHEKVREVRHASLPQNQFHELMKRQMAGPSSLMSFELGGGYDAAKQFINNLKLISHVANLGDAKTLAIHPASTTHHQLSSEQQLAAGISPGLIRMSVGLEDTDDLIREIEEVLTTL